MILVCVLHHWYRFYSYIITLTCVCIVDFIHSENYFNISVYFLSSCLKQPISHKVFM